MINLDDPLTISTGYLSEFLLILLSTALGKSILHLSDNLIRYIKTSANSSPKFSFSFSSQSFIMLIVNLVNRLIPPPSIKKVHLPLRPHQSLLTTGSWADEIGPNLFYNHH